MIVMVDFPVMEGAQTQDRRWRMSAALARNGPDDRCGFERQKGRLARRRVVLKHPPPQCYSSPSGSVVWDGFLRFRLRGAILPAFDYFGEQPPRDVLYTGNDRSPRRTWLLNERYAEEFRTEILSRGPL